MGDGRVRKKSDLRGGTAPPRVRVRQHCEALILTNHIPSYTPTDKMGRD